MMTKAKQPKGKHNLRELIGRIPKNYRAREIDWGRPAGKEIWWSVS
jgi:antitoxin component of MazEF toxin-antitoxin module